MAIRIVQLGSPRGSGEGLRIGTVRRPPRGVKKADRAKGNWFDVWLPNLSPSPELMRGRPIADDDKSWRAFERRFQAELKRPDASHLLDLLAALSRASSFSIGCYCDDENRCHRSILRRELEQRGADIALH
jgi:uncharacterized protein YeaO (DUF488 family)